MHVVSELIIIAQQYSAVAKACVPHPMVPPHAGLLGDTGQDCTHLAEPLLASGTFDGLSK